MKKILLTVFLLVGFVNGAYATDIQLTWTDPGTTVDGFIISHNVNGAQQEDIVVSDGTSREYLLVGALKGVHFFNIRSYVGEVNSTETPSNGVLLTDEITLTIEVK